MIGSYPDALLLVCLWLVTLLFYWKIFPTTYRPTSINPPPVTKPPSPLPPADSPFLAPLPPTGRRHSKRLEKELKTEVCCKAKEAAKHPSYVPLCLSLIHHYNLDINEPVLSNSFSIFHCSCLSGSVDLVSSLLPLANLYHLTDHWDSPLYLAVYATAHRAAGGEPDLAVVKLLLEKGCSANQANRAGFTALHRASRLGCLPLVRLLAESKVEESFGSSCGGRGGSSVRYRRGPGSASSRASTVINSTSSSLVRIMS